MNITSLFMTFYLVSIEILCSLNFIDTFLSSRLFTKKIKLSRFSTYICLLLASTISISMGKQFIVKALITILLYTLIIAILYEVNFFKSILISLINYLLIIVSDFFAIQIVISITFASIESIAMNEFYFIMVSTLSKALLLFITILINSVVKLKRSNNLSSIPKYHWIIYISLNIISLISITTLIKLSYSAENVSFLALFSTFSLLFINLLVFKLLEKSNYYEINKSHYALQQQQISMQLANIQLMTNSFETQRKNLHDYKNNLSTIYQLIDVDQNQAKSIISSITTELNHSVYKFKTNNVIIDAILNQKFIEAEKKNIVLDIRGTDLGTVTIEPKHLATILSNTIDNAIEATEKISSNRIVSIKLDISYDMLIYSIKNPITTIPKVINNQIETSKRNSSAHGWGLKSVADSLAECDGDYDIDILDNYFILTAMVKIAPKT